MVSMVAPSGKARTNRRLAIALLGAVVDVEVD